jgi:hypothetical protein
MPNIGATRIVRVDAHNVAVEQYTATEVVEKGEDGKRVKTGATREEWKEVGYYGHRIDHAAESALFVAMPEGEKITPQMIREAVFKIVAETNAAVGGSNAELS